MSIDTDRQPLFTNRCDAIERQRIGIQVIDLLAVHFGLTGKNLSPNLRLDEDLALDSLDLLDFGMVLRDQFRIELGIEVLRLPRTVGDMASLVAAALAEPGVQD